MTRRGKNASNGFLSSLGSIGRNMKRFAVVTALLFSSQMGEAFAEESQYKVRIHKNFVKEVIDKNFPIILNHLHTIQEKNKYLAEVNANIDNLSLRIEPKGDGNWEQVNSELFFDQGQIVMELQNLQYKGNGLITDPETSVQDVIHFQADMDLVQLVMSLEQELTKEGNLNPKIEITEVALTMHKDTFNIEQRGDLPLYKTHKFEEGIKKWFIGQLHSREADFKKELQRSEREIMQSFDFQKDIQISKEVSEAMGKRKAHSTLSETMTLNGDHIVVNFMTEYEGIDLQGISKKMRKIKPEFTSDAEHQRDVQIVLDENYINYYLFSLFYADKPVSLSEIIIGFIPETFAGAGAILKSVMNTKVLAVFFPDLENQKSRRADLKCAFSKSFLNEGHLEEQTLSSLKFKDDNKVEMDLHFGCQVLVYNSGIEGMQGDVEMLMEMFQALNTEDDDDSKWSVYRSFFTSMTAKFKLDFSEDAKQQKIPFQDTLNTFTGGKANAPKMSEHVPLIWGRVLDFEPRVNELKVLHNGRERVNEAKNLNDKIMMLREHEIYDNPFLKPVFELLFGHTIPIAPFPKFERCLGLDARDSQMKIVEGYAIMSYDFRARASTQDCLFNMKDSLIQKEMRMAEFAAKRKDTPMAKFEKQMKDMAGKALSQGLGNMDIPKMFNDPVVKGVLNMAQDKNLQNMAKDMMGKNNLFKEAEKGFKNFENVLLKKGKSPLDMLFQK